MKITFDGRSLFSPWTGIQYYLLELIRAINVDNPDVDMSFYLGSKLKVKKEFYQKIASLPINKLYYKPMAQSVFDRTKNKKGFSFFFSAIALPILPISKAKSIFDAKTDIFHQTDILSIPFSGKCKSILTVHDIIPRMFPKLFPKDVYEPFIEIVKQNVSKAKHIVADSQNTKDTLSFFFNVKPERISVVYAGISDLYKPIEDRKELDNVKQKYNLPENYLLFLGTIEPRKNIVRILKAFNQVRQIVDDTKLVICGRYGWEAEDVYAIYEELGLRDKVIFTGYIEDSDKPAIYSGARALVFPSLYEGFGLPPLESMACGTPVITSDRASLPEIVGDAAILVDPYKVDEIADGISKIVMDEKLNKELSEKGKDRASTFSWQNTAKQTIEVYKNLLS